MATMLTGLSLKWKRNEGTYSNILIFLGIFIAFLALRLIVWKNTVLLEDTDSLFYLNNIKTFLTFNIKEILDLSSDSTPFYPFFGALFSLPGWSVETGARLTSFFFSALLFVAIWGIGKQIAKSFEVFMGLIILCFSPVLISLSSSVLTEPSYIGTVYLGFWFFLTQYANPKLWKGAVLGLIFGLCFLNRVEGIIYIVVIPFLQGVHFAISGNKIYGLKKYIKWTIIFMCLFSLLAIPQILRVSHKTGFLVLNGRQIHQLILNNPDGKSVTEKFFGLDYSPGQTNFSYIREHPEVVKLFHSKLSLKEHVKRIIQKTNNLYQDKLGVMIGPLGLILFSFGFLALFESGYHFVSFFIFAFIGFNLIPELISPQVVTKVVIRHVAIIIPIILLMEGIGIVYISKRFDNRVQKRFSIGNILPFLLLFLLILVSAVPLKRTFKVHYSNSEYSPSELQKPIAIINNIVEHDFKRPTVIIAQRGYIAYFTDSRGFMLPYTNYGGLVNYCALNDVDLLYLKYSRVSDYPFFKVFQDKSSHPEFDSIYEGVDARGGKIELYRFINKTKYDLYYKN